MGNKVVKATEGIMDETGTICQGKQKVKVQGGKYFEATKYCRDAFDAFRSHFNSDEGASDFMVFLFL